jgi:hypothetical protein
VKLAKTFKRPNPLNDVLESRMKEMNIDKHDYHAMATLYFQVFNPSRISSVESLLMKHKVSFGARCHLLIHVKANFVAAPSCRAGKRRSHV